MRKVKEMLCAVLKKVGWLRKLNSKQQWLLLSVTLLLVALMLSGCASSSRNSRAVVVQPLSSAIAEPVDASSFYRERQKFCVHGIIGARQTGASNEHEHQTQFS